MPTIPFTPFLPHCLAAALCLAWLAPAPARAQLAAGAAPARFAKAGAGQLRRELEANLLILEVRLDGFSLSDGLTAYLDGPQILLPLGGARPARLADPGYPHDIAPYKWLDRPFIEQTFGANARDTAGLRRNAANYTAYLTADVLGMEGAAYVSSSRDQPDPDWRMKLGRNDPDAGLLGPLRARSFLLGNITLPSVANVMTSSGRGVSVSNRLLNQPTSFDRHSLGENLTLLGLLETGVWAGDLLRFANCALRVTLPREPCYKFNAAMGFGRASRLMAQTGFCGFYLAVQTPGTLRAGEPFELVPGRRSASIPTLFAARMHKHLR